jgi:DNA-binding SARP family transcriptional activator
MKTKLSVHLFGKFEITSKEHHWCCRENCKVHELFGFLLLHRQVPQNREQLAGVFWGETAMAQSKKYLRQTLWHLQSLCRSHLGLQSQELFLTEGETIVVNPEVELWIDVEAFQAVLRTLRPNLPLDEPTAQQLRVAVDLYQGDLLEGWYPDWCLYEREHLQNLYLAVLDKLTLYCEAQSDYETGLWYATRILQCDPARERAHQQIMRLAYVMGDRTAALRQYEHCREALQKELGVAPARQTRLLYERICLDQMESAPEPPLRMLPLPAISPSLPLTTILTHFRQLQTSLTQLQQELHTEIQLIERSLPQQK